MLGFSLKILFDSYTCFFIILFNISKLHLDANIQLIQQSIFLFLNKSSKSGNFINLLVSKSCRMLYIFIIKIYSILSKLI